MTDLAGNPAVLGCGFVGFTAAYWLLWIWSKPRDPHQTRRHYLGAWVAPHGEHHVVIVTAGMTATVVQLPGVDHQPATEGDSSVDELELLWQLPPGVERRRAVVAPAELPSSVSQGATAR